MPERSYPDATDPNGEVDRFANSLAGISCYGDNVSIVFSILRPAAGKLQETRIEHAVVARLVIPADLAKMVGEALLASVESKYPANKPAQH